MAEDDILNLYMVRNRQNGKFWHRRSNNCTGHWTSRNKASVWTNVKATAIVVSAIERYADGPTAEIVKLVGDLQCVSMADLPPPRPAVVPIPAVVPKRVRSIKAESPKKSNARTFGLSESQIISMRNRYAAGEDVLSLAAVFNVAEDTVWKACAGKHYKTFGGPITKRGQRGRIRTDEKLKNIEKMRKGVRMLETFLTSNMNSKSPCN